MARKSFIYQSKYLKRFAVGTILPLILTLLLVQALSAQEAIAADTVIEVSKSVNREEAVRGDTVQYTINAQNSGTDVLTDTLITDTVPAALAVDDTSFVVAGTSLGTLDVDGNVITWTGSISASGWVQIVFDAVVSDNAPYEIITNTVYLTGTGSLLSDPAVLTVKDEITYNLYLPIVSVPPPPPVPQLISVGKPTTSNGYDTFQFMVNWSNVGIGQYEVQESHTPDFAVATTYNAGNATSLNVDNAISHHYDYHYRVRYIRYDGKVSDWSNFIHQYGPYEDDFWDENSGWSIRREDLDDTDNYTFYEDGKFVVKIKGRWDFAIASPMKFVPWDAYRIETSVRFDSGVDNLHTYGIIWGADGPAAGQACPEPGFTTCFNHYYRLNVLWYGSTSKLRAGIKRIDYHDSDGQGRGSTRMSYTNIHVGNSKDYNRWAIEHSPEGRGQIDLFVNGELVKTVHDDDYTGAWTFFGVIATSNEYLGAEPWFDWYRVTPLD